jgi:hypothetical protein
MNDPAGISTIPSGTTFTQTPAWQAILSPQLVPFFAATLPQTPSLHESTVQALPSSHPTSLHPPPSPKQVAALPCAVHTFAPGWHTKHFPSTHSLPPSAAQSADATHPVAPALQVNTLPPSHFTAPTEQTAATHCPPMQTNPFNINACSIAVFFPGVLTFNLFI